jgi:hypothetical protein
MSEMEFKYHAFISYSQDPDKRLAMKLKANLEKFGLGWHRLKKQQMYIFRDATDLSLTQDLSSKIKEGLRQSEFLIVLAQRKLSLTAQSWVNQEIEYFIEICKERKIDPLDQIILVLTDGLIEWDRIKNSWNYEKTNVLPLILQNAFISQPLYADLRPLREAIPDRLKRKIFNDAVIVIVARLLKKKPGEIQNMVIRSQRIIISFGIVLMIVLMTLTIFSVIQSNIANLKKIEAQDNLELSQKSEKKAVEQTELAVKEKKRAEREAKRAEDEAYRANMARKEEAVQRKKAQENEKIAEMERSIAEFARDTAEIRRQEAVLARLKTDTLNQLLLAENLSILYNNSVLKNPDDAQLAIVYTDSVLKSVSIFNAYFNPNQSGHYNKIKSVYSALRGAYIANMPVSMNLKLSFSNIALARDGELYLLNRNGEFSGIKSGIAGKVPFKNNDLSIFEIIHAPGSNFVIYSLQDGSFEIFDLSSKNLIQFEFPADQFKAIINAAYYNDPDHTIKLVNKNGQLMNFIITENGKAAFISSEFLNEKIIKTCNLSGSLFTLDTKGILKQGNQAGQAGEQVFRNVSDFYADQAGKNLYVGFTNGTIGIYHADTRQLMVVFKLQYRINRLIFDEISRTLIVQEGSNKIRLLKLINNQFVDLCESQFSSQINDFLLTPKGRFYVLYGKDRLVSWAIEQNEMESELKNRKEIITLNE